jgi:hypothetical protein
MAAFTAAGGPTVWVARWAARLLGGCLFVFWGQFFVHHLEWFADWRNPPPAWVLGMQGLHFLMLLGLVVGWRWELLGGVLVLAGAVPFFTVAGGPNSVLFTLVTAAPAVLWLYCAWQARRAAPPPGSRATTDQGPVG